MKVLVTGSHFSPAQAFIEKLAEIEEVEIIYLGRKFTREGDSSKSAESQIFPRLGVKFIPITAGKLNRFISIESIISILKIPTGFIQAFYYLLKEQPDLIISFGGYTGLPVVICGYLLSIQSIIHEQGLKMGLANYISAFFADKVAVSFKNFKVPVFLSTDKFIITGNPVRKEFLVPGNSPGDEIKNFVGSIKGGTPLLLVTAGNQGSHKINLLVEDKLTELTKNVSVIHQTGDSKFDDFGNLKKFESKNYLVKKWIDAVDLNFVMERTNLAVCRAGINTLIELSLKSVPTLIIPISIGNEQKNNAKFFSGLGLGESSDEINLTPETFIKKIISMLRNRKKLKVSARNAKNKIILGAEKRLVQEVLLMDNLRKNPGLNFR